MSEVSLFPDMLSNVLLWLAIIVCLSQSALFSGMNIAVFSISRLRLEVEAASGNTGAQRVLELRQHSNHVLTTILWGNVAINVIRESHTLLGVVLTRLESSPLKPGAHGVDVLLVWTDPPRLISGDDILRRLLTGVGPLKRTRA